MNAAIIQPDAKGEFPTPLDGALWMASFGIPQTPLRGKAPFLTAFQHSATTDPEQIRSWASQYPGCNFGSVAHEGQHFVFEADSTDVRKRFKETGNDFTSELIIRSREGRGHRWYKHVAGVKNVSQTYTKHQDFSIRAESQQCVSPGSIHPITGKQYSVVSGGSPKVPSAAEIAFWESERAEKKVDGKQDVPRNDAGKIPHGKIHGWLVSQGGRLRQNGLETDEIETVLLRQAHAECEEPLDDAKIVQVARSMGNYEKGTPWQNIVALNQQSDKIAGPTAPTVDEDEEPEESLDNGQDEFPRCPIFPGALTELARAMYPSLPLDFKQWGMIARWGLLRSGIDTFGIEKHLQPRFYSVLVSKPNRGKTASINETRNAFDTIYGKMRGDGTKKARVCNEPDSIPSVDSGQFFSDEFARMVKVAKSQYDAGACTDLTGKMMLDPDELSDVFEKGRVTQGRVSTMFIELLKLHSGNRTGSGTKKDGKSAVTNAHLSILAGTTTRKYPMLWTGTGGGADGLVSRFIPITTNNPPVPPVPLPSDFATAEKMYVRLSRLAELPGQTIMLDDEASKMLMDWWGSFDSGKESATRVLETIKQLLIVLAVTNLPENHQGTTVTVDADLMTYAIQFGEYVIAVRELINPGDSWSIVQAMENTIIDWAKKHTSKTDPKTMRDARRGIHPERLPGGLGTFKMAWRNCVETDVLKVRDKGHKGNGKYSM